MTNVLDTAKKAIIQGISVLPIPANGTKYPGDYWLDYQKARATIEDWEGWMKRAPDCGLCFITGPISGNLELLEADSMDAYQAFRQAVEDSGEVELLELIEQGYLEYTPKGVHLLYRVPDLNPFPGNTKLAGSK